jgi:AcrR family transcriptional regulator
MSPEERREQILQAAMSCFGEKGYHAATMDDLVRASGLSKGSLYWHFRSKEEVFLALFDSFEALLYREWDVAADSGAPARTVLRRECDFTIETLSANRLFLLAWSEFLNHPIARERMAQIYTTTREKLGAIVEQGRRDGTFKPGPPGEQIAGAVVAAIEGLCVQWLVDPDFPLRTHFDSTWDIMMGGLCP